MSFKSFQRLHLLVILLSDLLTGIASFLVAFQIAWLISQATNPYSTWLPFKPYLKLTIVWTFLNLLIFSLGGLYSRGPWGSFGRELGQVLTSISISMIVGMALTFLIRNFDFSRLFFMVAWLCAVIMFWIERGILRWIRRVINARGSGVRKLIIWGSDEVAEVLLKLYENEPWRGKRPIAIIDGWDNNKTEVRIPILSPEEGRKLIERGDVDEVIVTRHDLPRDVLYKLAQSCRTREVALKLVPDLLEVVAGRMEMEGVEGIPMLEMGNNLGRLYPQVVKRMFDIIVGGFITIILLPVLGLIALIIKIDSSGPVLFVHWRLGKGRVKFGQYKFRTMVQNAEEILASNPELRAQFEQDYKLKNDPRVTRVGAFLRKWSLDELPQLFNVLKGEMSLVGPRPIVENEIEKYGIFADALFSITPGMTGLWQVSGRSDVGYEERVKLDLLYIERWSLWEDLKIILLTPGAVLSRRGSY